jgi:hypothetical protein
LKAALVERMLGGELSHHLGYAPGGTKPDAAANHRNGTSPKTVLTDDGPVELAVPPARAGTFEPVLVPRIRGGCPASMTKSSRCTGAACPRARFRSFCARSIRSTSRRI